jgi:hypothetical protein
MAERSYQRLTRPRQRTVIMGIGFVNRSSLWLGRDHLLCVDSTGYTEDYKRFYFRDIQSITLRRTTRRFVTNFCLVIFLLITGFPIAYFYSIGETTGVVGFGIVMAALLIGLIVNSALGPTTVGYLRTAVQVEDLPSLARLSKSHKVLARLRPLIAAEQGQLTPEALAERLAAMGPFPAETTAPVPPPLGP